MKKLFFLVLVVLFLAGCSSDEHKPPSGAKITTGPYLEDAYVGTIEVRKVPGPHEIVPSSEFYYWTKFEVDINPDRDCVTIGKNTISAHFRVRRGYVWLEGPADTYCIKRK
jgi:hypothetical protein